jgi:hypothetical protein
MITYDLSLHLLIFIANSINTCRRIAQAIWEEGDYRFIPVRLVDEILNPILI